MLVRSLKLIFFIKIVSQKALQFNVRSFPSIQKYIFVHEKQKFFGENTFYLFSGALCIQWLC